MCLYAHAQSPEGSGAAASGNLPDTITPLQIGDAVPEETWNTPLSLYNASDNSTKTVTLADYRGKLIILDFWATWCSACLYYMPHQFALQEQFGDDIVTLPVTYEKAEYVGEFIRNSSYERLKPLKSIFLTIAENESLLKHFPLNTPLPLIVVISPDGKVDAVTKPMLLTEEYIAGAIEGTERYAPLKRGTIEQLPPLLEYSLSDVKQYKPVYYTSISGEIDGASSIQRTLVDSLTGTVRNVLANCTVLELYAVGQYADTQRVFSFAGPRKENRVIVEVRKPYNYLHHYDESIQKRSVFDLKWRRANRYTYEAVLPLHTKAQFKKRLVNDLNTFFGLEGRIEKRRVPVWVVKVGEMFKSSTLPHADFKIVNDGWIKSRVAADQYVGPNSMGFKNYVENLNSQSLSGYIMSYFSRPKKGLLSPPVIDETALPPNTRINIGMPEPEGLTFPELSKVLASQGILLLEEEREIPMFVLTEPGFETEPDEKLVLTKYGYIPESNLKYLEKK